MPIERIGFVLCKDGDSLQLRIDTVRQSKIDNSVNSAERHRRLGTMLRQRIKPFTLSAGQDDSEGILNDGACPWSYSLQRTFTPRTLCNFSPLYFFVGAGLTCV